MNKHITRIELDQLIKDANEYDNWSPVEQADVSEITDMSWLFFNVAGIGSLDLSSWDTSSVTNMSFMFFYSDFNQPLTFNTANVINMDSMFSNSKYNQPLLFDTSNVKNMSHMFHKSKYNKQLNFNTSNVTNMHDMFKDSKFTGDISDWDILDNENNADIIKYKAECIKIRKEKEKIKSALSKKNNDSNNNNNNNVELLKL